MASPNVNLFAWHELMTNDTEAAKAFYGNVIGWGTQSWPDPAMKYTMWTNANGPVGGLMNLEDAQQAGAPPYWMGTISVDDIEATVAKAIELGANVLAPINEIPNVGRFAVIADPTGAAFSVLESSDPAPALNIREMGRISWNELWTTDPEAAWNFYRQLFGWVETGTMEMAPGMTYRMFARAGEASMGGIGMKQPEQPVSAWLFYATVDSADHACTRARESGAHIFMETMDVPGGGRIFAGIDPQGAAFAAYSHGAES